MRDTEPVDDAARRTVRSFRSPKGVESQSPVEASQKDGPTSPGKTMPEQAVRLRISVRLDLLLA
jgi:hypothetical protein